MAEKALKTYNKQFHYNWSKIKSNTLGRLKSRNFNDVDRSGRDVARTRNDVYMWN